MEYTIERACKCGCGQIVGRVARNTFLRFKRGDPTAGWIVGHRQRGALNPGYNNGTTITSSGYRMVRCPDHPNAVAAGMILEHRLVMSGALGRPLRDDEVVHHINHDKLDNRLENLEVHSVQSHMRLHPTRKFTRAPKKCATCGAEFAKQRIEAHRKARFCSLPCVMKRPDPYRKLTDAQRSEIIALRGEVTYKEIAARYGVCHGTVKNLMAQRIHHHIP